MEYRYRHPFATVLGPLGTRSTDGRTLSITGRFGIPSGVVPVVGQDGNHLLGMVTRIDARDGWLWAYGAVALQWHAIHLRSGLLVLLAELEITGERTTLDGMDIQEATLRGAQMRTPNHWPWEDMWPART